MKDIIRITIKSEPGFCCVEEAYRDKITITKDSIRYEYTPRIESERNVSRKWSYKTTSPIYQKLFKNAVLAVEAILNWEMNPFDADDVGVTTFTVTYDDKSKQTREYFLSGDDFRECFSIIKQMVPGCEYIPAVLLFSEDYEED